MKEAQAKSILKSLQEKRAMQELVVRMVRCMSHDEVEHVLNFILEDGDFDND